ncbi:MAG: hypothetical protein VX379_01160 [Pseudomonadota bacterium]|uniref:hypothetical protein n=1 Tax=Alcanivorax sp. TaxID=1872427 RepID=UPI00243A298E|nr:hypothetical protein [Alcanivorax sp.]MED5238171.1 hypothetical protein [Pseudomonadota bacterium]MEE3320939.1 hypothetical protein [Pseudomonadota bacterium]
MKTLFLTGLLALLSVSAHAEWSLGQYHGHPYAGEHGLHDGAAKFAVGMLCKQESEQPAYVLAHRRFVTAGGPGTDLASQFEAGEVAREFYVDGVPYGDVGPRYGEHDASNHLLIFASAVSLNSPIIKALRKGATLEVVYLDQEGSALYVSDFSLKGSAAAIDQVACPD